MADLRHQLVAADVLAAAAVRAGQRRALAVGSGGLRCRRLWRRRDVMVWVWYRGKPMLWRRR